MSKKTRSIKLFNNGRKRLIAFSLIFGLIGTYLLISTRAATIAPTGTYTDWYWPTTTPGYQSFEWEVTPKVDPTPDGYFWAHQFQFNNGDGGYFGLQTQGANPTGKIAIFSVWQALAAQGPQVATTFGGEGTGYTVRIKYPWVSGQRYRLRVARQPVDLNWWGAWVKNVSTGAEAYVGQIKLPQTWKGLGNWSVMWTERYSGSLSSCSVMKYSSVVFSKPSANNGSVSPNGQNNHLGNPINCPGSKISNIDGGILQEMAIPAEALPASPTDDDKTPPTVTISAPSDGQFVSGRIQINGTASDEVGVVSSELYINGTRKQSSDDASISYLWNIPRWMINKNNDGTQVIEIKAKDQAGNVGTSKITIYTK